MLHLKVRRQYQFGEYPFIWGCKLRAPNHLGLVQCLGLILALLCNQFILDSHRINDAVQVQGAIVVHRQDDIGVTDVRLHLGELL